MTARRTRLAATIGLALAVTACSTKASDSGGGEGAGGLKTDVGVTDKDITLLELEDLSGVFKVTSLAYSKGTAIWAEEVNAAGGICERQVKIDLQDTGYKVENAMPQYEAQKGSSLGIMGLGGSQILAALKSKITTDKMMTIPGSWASVNLDTDYVLMVGQTYDVEMINALSFLQEKGSIADGDKIGHIYVDSELGQNAFLGAQAYADEHSMEIVEAKIASTDTDMTATMTKLKSEGVKAIAVTSPPGALGSAAVQNVAQGLNVPIVGTSVSFAPTLLTDPSVESALSQYYLVSSAAPISIDKPAAKTLLEKYEAMTSDEPSIGVIHGYVWGKTWEEILKKACDSGDMTREGVLKARQEVTSVDTGDLFGTLDLSQLGAPTSREAYILSVDKSQAGGLKVEKELFESEEAKEYKAPFQE